MRHWYTLLLLTCCTAAADTVPASPPLATPTRRGLVGTVDQAWAGRKTFITPPLVDGGAGAPPLAVQTVTESPTTFYLDPGGNDSNTCTAPDAGCLTAREVMRRIPRRVDADVTVEVASGVYLSAADFQVDRVEVSRNASIIVRGQLVPWTPPSGPQAGVTTGATAGGTAGPATFTDSAASWAVDSLRGRFVLFDGGSLSGTAQAVASNTATTVTVVSGTSPGTGVAYSVVEPGPRFVSDAGALWAGFDKASGLLTFSNMSVEHLGSVAAVQLTAMAANISTVNLRVTSTATAFPAINVFSGTLLLTRGTVESAGTGVQVGSVSYQWQWPPTVGVLGLMVRTTGASSAGIVRTPGGPGGSNPAGTTYVEVVGGVGLDLRGSVGSPGGVGSNTWIRCTGAGTAVRAGFVPAVATASVLTSAGWNAGNRVTGCAVGLHAAAGSWLGVGTWAFDGTTTALQASRGGQLDLLGATPTFTGVTNELQLDGVNYTLATLSATGPPAILQSAWGSRLIR